MTVIRNNWWATPVWEFQTDFDHNFNQALLNEVSEYYSTVQLDDIKNVWNSTGPCITQLNKTILQIVQNATYEDLVADFSDTNLNYYNVRAWVNYHPTGKDNSIHDHSGRKLTATYYINAPDDSGDLLLIDPRGGVDWGTVAGKKFHRVKPTEGKLVFFPGFLLHMVESNQSPDPRISLTSDIVVMPDAFIKYIKEC